MDPDQNSLTTPKEHSHTPKDSGSYRQTKSSAKHQGKFKIRDDLTSKLQRYRTKPKTDLAVKSTPNKIPATLLTGRCLDDAVLIDSCKPLVEDVKKSLRELEASIDQAGDQPVI